MRLWENWTCMGFLLFISITIVGIIYGVGKLQQNSKVTRPKRSLKRDTCLTKYGGIELDYVENSAMSFTFDICSVFNCQGKNSSWRGYDVYLCAPPALVEDCGEGGGRYFIGSGCDDWGQVTKYSGLSFQRDYSTTQNPVTLSISQITESSYKKKKVYAFLGVDQTGKDPIGLVLINIVPKTKPNVTETRNVSVVSMVDKHVSVDYTKLTPEDIIEKATGYGETNLWLEWLINTAKEQKNR